MRLNSARILVMVVITVLLFSMVSTAVAAPENDEGMVRFIEIKGNSIIDTATIRSAILKTKLDEPMVESNVLDDLHSIYDLGFFQDASASFDPIFGGVQVVFHVEENPVVEEIAFTGLTSIAFGDFKKKMKTQVGYILNVYDLGEDLQDLLEWVGEEYGYIARIADLEADTDGRIQIEVAQASLKDIVIEGNQKTKDFVINRELSFEIGEPVNLHEIDQSLRRILMLGFFEEISRDFSEEDDPDQTVLTINLTESKTGSATFGAAYNSVDKLIGFLEVADENFLGRGQRVNATLELGKQKQSYELGFFEPYIHKSGTSLGVNLYRRNKKTTDNGDEEKLVVTGTDLTVGHPFGDFSRGRLSLKLENNKYEKGTNTTIGSTGFGFSTNTIDHPFFPTEGFKSDAYLEFGKALFGGDTQYAKLQAEYSRFFEIKDGGYVVALRGLGGRLLGGELEAGSKFAIGGADTLRGYRFGGGDGLEGDHMMVVNAEFRFPIVEKLTGVVFTDWGTTWNKDEVFAPYDLKNGFGVGVRLDTPLGLFRLDYGLGKDESNQRKGQFYFGLGQTF